MQLTNTTTIAADTEKTKMSTHFLSYPDSEYSYLLREHNIEFIQIDHYFQVGKIDWTQGWIIDIAVIPIQYSKLLKVILPTLIAEKIAFRMAIDDQKARALLGGDLGYLLLGKLVSIYPYDDISALTIAKKLISLTKSFKGPQIITDLLLQGVIYTKYGSCNPIYRVNPNGIKEKYIYSSNGDLVKDSCVIPFVLPKGIKWPFTSITPAKAPKKETVLQDKYKPMAVLKEDVKGTVKKGLWLEKWYKINWCVIKEGKQNMFGDSNGRDITDRLRWQFELYQNLKGDVPIPKIYDLFEENGDTYLIMEYIRGSALEHTIKNIFNGNPWAQLSLKDRLILLDHTSQVIDIIEQMHKKGYIHRDITPANFLVTKKNKLWMIDLELSYSQHCRKPYPPFRLGTPGFMSPEQFETLLPTPEQDIYAIGALSIYALTGLPPYKFTTTNKNILLEQLSFFLQDEDIVLLISNCFDNNPSIRPTLISVKETLRIFTEKQKVEKSDSNQINQVSSNAVLKETITNALQGLTSPIMMTEDHLWISKAAQEEQFSYCQDTSVTVCNDFYQGLSGILWVLAKAHKLNFLNSHCLKAYETNISHLRASSEELISENTAGLYSGTAGISMCLIEGIRSKLIIDVSEAIEEIKVNLLKENTDGAGITKGIAGQGMALLDSSVLLPEIFVKPLLEQKVTQLLLMQEKDGAWMTETEKNRNLIKPTGFGHGVAGIICFLSQYLKFHQTERALQALVKGMDWLISQANRKHEHILWPIHNKTKRLSSDFQEGCAGVILSLVKAYEVTGDLNYRHLAEDCLKNYPKYGTNLDLTLASGIVGIGEVYLEAARVFKSEEWLHRANWVAEFLMHQVKHKKNGSCYWMVNNPTLSTAGFLTGNCGIIYFLLRCHAPEQLNHPLLVF